MGIREHIERLEEELRKRRRAQNRSSPRNLIERMKESIAKKDDPVSPETGSLLSRILKITAPREELSESHRAAIAMERGYESAEKAKRNWSMRNRPESKEGSAGWDSFLPDHPELQAKARARAIKRAQLAKEKHTANNVMADQFKAQVLDAEGNIDAERLASADYPIRAWYEKNRVISGEGREMQGGVIGSDWYESLSPIEKRRYDRLVKISHFGTRGRSMVVPHPTSEGHFILVDHKGDRVENPDFHGRMDKVRRMERNQRNIDENPEYYEKAFQRRRDRERHMDARREMRRGNRHKAISINMNLPMDHPAVIDAVMGKAHSMPKGRYWRGNPNLPGALTGGPSDSAAYWADYYDTGVDEDDDSDSRSAKTYKDVLAATKPTPRREYAPTNPEELNVYQGVVRADAALKDAQAAYRKAGENPLTPAQHAEYKQDIQLAEMKLQEAEKEFKAKGYTTTPTPQVPGMSSWPSPPERKEDIRGKNFFGHYDHKYGGGDPTSAWHQLSPAQGGAGSDVHALYKDWKDWVSPEERAALAEAEAEAERRRRERRMQQMEQQSNLAQEQVAPQEGPSPEQGLSPPQRNEIEPQVQAQQQTPAQAQPQQQGTYDGAVSEAPLEELAQSQRAQDAGLLTPGMPEVSQAKQNWVVSKRADYRPIAGGDQETINQNINDPSLIKPYQPMVSSDGSMQWEPVSQEQYRKDAAFDAAVGPQLWDLKNQLDSTDLRNPEAPFAFSYEGMASNNQGRNWYLTFMQQARPIVAQYYLGGQGTEEQPIPPEALNQIDTMIFRWGDRHLTGSSNWRMNSPSMVRGREVIPDENPGLGSGIMDSVNAITGWDRVRPQARGPRLSKERLGSVLENAWDYIRLPFETAGEYTGIIESDPERARERQRLRDAGKAELQRTWDNL